MSKPAPTPFDYEQLDTQTHQFLQQKADEIHGLLRRTAEHILRIGQTLQAVKEALPHGQFLLWIETEFEMSRWTARNFIHVAEKLEDKWRNFHHLPVSVLYELASPSTSEEILAHVQEGNIVPTLEAVRAAKEAERLAREAERQARADVDASQQQLFTVRQEIQTKQATIEQLTQEITSLQARLASLAPPPVEVREVEKLVVPPEVKAQVEHLTQQLQTLTQQRDALGQQVTQLRQEARAAALKQNEGGQERRIRLNWYTVTNEFRAAVTKLLAQWPSPIDTMVFEADDWTRLSHTTEVARRFLDACVTLSQGRIVDSMTLSPDERTDLQ